MLAATALAVAALGTPIAQAAPDMPPGPAAAAALPPGVDPGGGGEDLYARAPGAQAATDLRGDPGTGGDESYARGPGAQAAIIAI